MGFNKLSSRLVVASLSFCILSWTSAQTCDNKPSNATVFCSMAEVGDAASTGSINATALEMVQIFDECTEEQLKEPFREANGTCNNKLNNGAAGRPPRRLLDNAYDDGRDVPRVRGEGGFVLPSAANISRTVHPRNDVNQRFTIMLMQWGQFIDHDITGFPIASEVDRSLRCCTENGELLPYFFNRECFPILLTKEDINRRFVGNCHEFARSVAARDETGRQIYPREQVNAVTSFIDASMVYGNSKELQEKLREKIGQRVGFLLRTSPGDLLPRNEEEQNCNAQPGEFCFLAGDSRVNEQPGLIAMHTLFVRLHNQIARELAKARPKDTDEQIFQLTRKIIGAIIQHIQYNEWLPLIIGRQTASRSDLLPRRGVNRIKSDPTVDPRIINVFSTAAFRLGHTLIPSGLNISGRFRPLRELFNRPDLLFEQNGLSNVLQALVLPPRAQGSQTLDRFFTEEITGHLFEPENVEDGKPSRGLDLVALNIQRGRDHGLPPYNEYRKLCGLMPLESFDDLPENTRLRKPENRRRERERRIKAFRSVYRSVNDIDIFSGGIAEPPVARGSIVGPTLSCLLVKQFRALKFGDRFHYETDSTPERFTDDQLKAIRNITLAHVCCQSKAVQKVQRRAFESVSPDTDRNDFVECSALRGTKFLDPKLFEDFS